MGSVDAIRKGVMCHRIANMISRPGDESETPFHQGWWSSLPHPAPAALVGPWWRWRLLLLLPSSSMQPWEVGLLEHG